MKKNKQTALTAALFAAALSAASVAGGQATAETDVPEQPSFNPTQPEYQAVYGPPEWFGITLPAEPEFDATQPEFQEVYGPPEWFTEPVTEEATLQDDDKPTETTMPTFAPVYGPPSVLAGDINNDGRVDAFDLVRLRSIVAEDESMMNDAMAPADINKDGRVNIADLVSMARFLVGRQDGWEHNRLAMYDENGNYVWDPLEEVPEPAYGPPIGWEDPTESVAPTEYIPEPDYGPPYWDEPTEPMTEAQEPATQAVTAPAEEETNPFYEIPQPKYGPPSWFGLEDK